MADDLTSSGNLARVAYEKNLVEARSAALTLRVRRGELVHRRAAEAAHFTLGTRLRDQMLTASSRHAALLAARYGLDAGVLATELDAIVRELLTELADRGEAETNNRKSGV